MLPRRHKPGQHVLLNRLDLLAERGQRPAAQDPQHVVVTPLPFDPVRSELTPNHPTLAFQILQGANGPMGFDTEGGRKFVSEERTVGPGVAGHQIGQRFLDRVGEGCRQTGRQCDAEGVPEPGGVFGCGIDLPRPGTGPVGLRAGPALTGTGIRTSGDVTDGDNAALVQELGQCRLGLDPVDPLGHLGH